MTIPDVVKIGAITYRVEFAELEDAGECDTIKQVIRLNSAASQEMKELTFIHEIMHALNSEFSDGPMHAFMDSLSGQLYQVFKENHLLA